MNNLDNDPIAPAVSSDYKLVFIGLLNDETCKTTIGEPENVIISVGVDDE